MATSGSQSNQSTMRDRAHHLAGEVVDKVQETAGRVTGVGQDDGQSASMTDQATEQVTSRLDMGKDFLVETITGVAQALRQTGQHLREEGAQPMLAGYADRGAEQIERIGGHMRQRDATELLGEIEGFARRRPMVFAGGAFALGMLAVRFLRSSGERAQQAPTSFGATPTASSYAGSHSGASPMTRGTTGGVPPTSSTPQSYAGTGTTTSGAVPSGAGGMPSRPAGTQPAPASPQSSEYTDSGLGLSPGTSSSSHETTASPSEPVTPRATPVPSRSGSAGGTGAARPESGIGAQPGTWSGDDASSSGPPGTGSRNQP